MVRLPSWNFTLLTIWSRILTSPWPWIIFRVLCQGKDVLRFSIASKITIWHFSSFWVKRWYDLRSYRQILAIFYDVVLLAVIELKWPFLTQSIINLKIWILKYETKLNDSLRTQNKQGIKFRKFFWRVSLIYFQSRMAHLTIGGQTYLRIKT